jgi:hypothetical protein
MPGHILCEFNQKRNNTMTPNTLETAHLAADHTLTQAELDRARLYLDQTKSGMVGATRHLSDAQWKYKPGPDRWSTAEIVEHVILVQERVLGTLRNKLDQAPVTPPHPDYRRVDDIVIYQIPSRLSKFPSPAQPAGDLARSDALKRFLTNCARLNQYLETTPGLRNRSVEAPPVKAVSGGAYETMDGYQWILAAAAHTERHTKQVLEVMADPGFPS